MYRSVRAVLLVSLLAVVASCQQKSESTGSAATPESSAKAPVGKVEKALANAVGERAPASASSSGPPPDGILDPTRAEADAPSGQAPKLTIGSNGSEPRVILRSQRANLPRALKVEVTLQSGMDQGLPPIEMTIGLESKTLAPTVNKLGEAKPEGKSLSVTGRVRDVKVTMPNVPQEFSSQLAGLKGGKVTFSMASDGGGHAFASELAAGAKPELRDLLDAVAEALTLATLPLPMVPVGSGAFWMVTAREKSSGFGLVAYHMVKLVRADDKSAELELDSRRYAIGRIVDPAMLPPGSENVTLKEISAGAKGRIQLAVDGLLPTSVQANASLRGALDSGEGAPKRAVQSGTSYRITVVR